jgi:hypothetical protein
MFFLKDEVECLGNMLGMSAMDSCKETITEAIAGFFVDEEKL